MKRAAVQSEFSFPYVHVGYIEAGEAVGIRRRMMMMMAMVMIMTIMMMIMMIMMMMMINDDHDDDHDPDRSQMMITTPHEHRTSTPIDVRVALCRRQPGCEEPIPRWRVVATVVGCGRCLCSRQCATQRS